MLMRQGLTTEAKQVVLDKKFVHSDESWVALEFHRLCFDLELNELARGYATSFLEKKPHDNFMTTRLVLLNMLLRSPQAPKTPKESDKGIIARMVGRITNTDSH